MPTKVGAGGKPQNYGKGGRYAASHSIPGVDVDTWARQRLSEHGPMFGSRPEVVSTADRFRSAVPADAEIRIRVPESVIGRIADDGRFKTQHESGSSRGTFNPSMRQGEEDTMFGGSNPIYGYVHNPHDANHTISLQEAYGTVAVVLKPEVKDRTTVTFGDSLFPGNAPAPIPIHEIPTARNERLYVAATEAKNPSDYNPDPKPGYVEAQVHGGVSVSDIARIEIAPDTYRPDVERVEATRAAVERMFPGIPVVGIPSRDQHFGLEALAARVL